MKMVQSLIRAEQILKLLAERQTALSLSQIAQGVGLPKKHSHAWCSRNRAFLRENLFSILKPFVSLL